MHYTSELNPQIQPNTSEASENTVQDLLALAFNVHVSKCTMAHVCNLSIKRLRQQDYCEFKASRRYIVSSSGSI